MEIPPGAPDGRDHLQGLEASTAARDGRLVLVVTVAQHPVFSRSEAAPENLYCNASVGLLDALLGFDRKLTGLSGERLLVEHRRVAFSSFTLSIRDEGLPVFGNATQRGQVTVFIRVDFPKTLTALRRTCCGVGLSPRLGSSSSSGRCAPVRADRRAGLGRGRLREAVRRRRRGGLRAGPFVQYVVAEHGRCELSVCCSTCCPASCRAGEIAAVQTPAHHARHWVSLGTLGIMLETPELHAGLAPPSDTSFCALLFGSGTRFQPHAARSKSGPAARAGAARGLARAHVAARGGADAKHRARLQDRLLPRRRARLEDAPAAPEEQLWAAS